ncbi:MAG: DNA topoisomerase IV subunit A [Elsteraceae bacterium]
MTTTPAGLPPAAELRNTDLADALGERYLSYALSTIVSRSLPDVRDGLKPVHRRILYAMSQLGLDPRSGYKKAARVVGDVIGKFHPHGDVAVYEAMVRLAQDFAVRYPLVDGQGNFGNVDGDNAAAMRYTEAKLTTVAEALLNGLDDDAVDFRATYDGEGSEPVVLPAAFPNLLANGSTGIAVGMATSIPPHNVGELCAALKHLLAKPDASVGDLMAYIKGPDFPTGGVIVEPPDVIQAAYETGRGGFRVRAAWEVEKLKNGLWQVVVTEIPYQVQKSGLIEKTAELLEQKKLALLGDIRDESDEKIRIVLEPKTRNVDPAVLMESLFRQSPFETRVSLNMNVLDASSIPRVMDLREVLRAFLDHRRDVLQRVSRHRLAEIERRLEILAGYLIAYLNLDEVIRIIREEDEPKQELMQTFSLTDNQAEAILNMRLRSLRKLEEMEIRREHDKLSTEGADLRALLAEESRQWRQVGKEIGEIDKKFGEATELGKRRTSFSLASPSLVIPVEAFIEREPLTIAVSQQGWVRALKGHVIDLAELKHKAGDDGRFLIRAESTDKLLLLATDGRFYTLGADKLPRGRGFGEPLRLMLDLGQEEEIVSIQVHRPGSRLLVASSDGRGFVANADDALAQTRAGKQILTPSEGAKASHCLMIGNEDGVAVIGQNRRLLIFKLEEVPEMARGRGVILQRYGDGGMSDLKLFVMAEGLTHPFGERMRTVTDLTPWLNRRAAQGKLPPTGFPRNNKFGGPVA